MRLTLHTDYALRVLIHVGVADGKLITINDIATTFGISKQHLMKVVNNLSQKGYLQTVRGRGGGIRLSRPPRDIKVGEVVRETEETLGVVGCLEGSSSPSRSALPRPGRRGLPARARTLVSDLVDDEQLRHCHRSMHDLLDAPLALRVEISFQTMIASLANSGRASESANPFKLVEACD